MDLGDGVRKTMRYHHLGIPTDVEREEEIFLPELGMYVKSFRSNPFGIEWVRFEKDAPFPELVKTTPHLAFQVENLEAAISGREVLIPPNAPSEGVRVAFVVHEGAPVEFLEFDGPHPDRLDEGVGGGRDPAEGPIAGSWGEVEERKTQPGE